MCDNIWHRSWENRKSLEVKFKHTLAWKTDTTPRLDYKPVTIDMWKPVERKY